MSTSLIKFKRSETAGRMAQGGRILAAGEPAVDFDAGTFYIGDGITSPGLVFASTDSTASIHQIASTTGIGSSHTITATELGQVLRATGETTARMERLGFYDLGPITDIDSGSEVIHTGSDSTGMSGRWHWMNQTHVGNPRSIFYTEADYANVGSGTGSGLGNMSHSGVTNADDITGFQLKSMGYDIVTLPDTTGGVMALVAKKSGANNVLQFKRIGAEDLTGGAPVHDMTSSSHTGPTNSIFYTGATTAVLRLSYSADATGSVLKKLSANTLGFGKLAFADLTGDVKFAGQYAEEGFTLRYDIENTRWESTNSLRTLRTSTYSGIHVSNPGFTGRPSIAGSSPYIYLRDYGGSINTALEIIIPNSTGEDESEVGQATLNSFAAKKVTFATEKGNDGNKDILFYTATSRGSNVAPNIWMRNDGALWVNAVDLETTSTSTTAPGNPSEGVIRSLYVYPRDIRRSGSAPSTYAGWNGLELGAFRHYQHINSTPNSVGLNGIYLDSISSINGIGSITAASHHDICFIKGINLNTPASATGIKFGTITSGLKSSADANGIDITSITSTAATGTSTAFHVGTVAASGDTGTGIGFHIGSLTAGFSAFGLTISAMESGADSFFTYAPSIVANYQAAGTFITSIDSTGITSAIAMGTRISNITSTQLAIGGYYPNISGGIRSIGLFLGMNDPGKTYSDVTEASVAIYTAGGTHTFGGDVNVIGDFTSNGDYFEINAGTRITLDGAVKVDTGRRVEIVGVTTDTGDIGKPATPSMQIDNGHLLMVNGLVIQPLIEKTITAGMSGWTGHAQDINDTAGFLTSVEAKTTSVVRVHFNDSINKTLYRIGKGFDGQIITFINNSLSRDLAFSVNYTIGNCDIGGVNGDYFYLRPYNAISFMCNHSTGLTGSVYGHTNYKWMPINYNMIT